MADIIDKDLKVVLGQLIKVNNLKKKNNENNIYVTLQVQDENGKNERCLLFTQIEISDMETIRASFLDKLVQGRIYQCLIGKRPTNIIKVCNYYGETKYLRLSNTQLLKAEKRAQRNKEDLTKKSFITNLMD